MTAQPGTWSAAPLAAAPEQLAGLAALLDEAAGALTERGTATHAWTGTAAEEAANRQVGLGVRIADLVEGLRPGVSAIARAADGLARLVATVRLTELASALAGDPLATSLHTARAGAAAERLADEIDGELVAALTGMLRRPPRPADQPRAPARTEVRVWWAALPPAEQDLAVRQRPEIVGAGDGLPVWARDRANRILLDRADARLAREVADLEPAPQSWRDLLHGEPGLAGATTIGTFGGGARRVAHEEAVAKLAAVRATREVLDARDGEPRQLLTFDVSGRSARVAVAVGDVDRAGHVAVVVPGFTTTVEHDLAGSDRVAADLRRTSRHEAALLGDRRDVAVVSWLGYDVPQAADTLRSPHSVVLRTSAEAGAATLAGFLRGIPSDRHLTLVGHSYGSTTAGLAVARGGTGVDDLVVAGSPGLGVDAAAELPLPARRVHVLEARDDPVADLGWFGRDPDRLPGVDRLSTTAGDLPDGGPGTASAGHSQYFVPGTTSQWNVGAVVAGAPSVPAGRPPASW